jgi:hypothetical protein
MAKKDTVVSTEVLATGKFAPLLSTLSEKEAQEFEALSDDVKEMRLAIYEDMLMSSSSDLGDFVEIANKNENIEIFSAGSAMLREGKPVRVRLHGTVYIKSKDFKENWTEKKDANGGVYYLNQFFQVETVGSGHVFGIWNYPTLRKLEKIHTVTSGSIAGDKDPIIEITYVGKIEGREVLKRDHKIDLKQGNSAHVFIVKAEKSANIEAYATGCVNPLNSNELETSTGPKLSRDEATKANFERLMALQSGTAPKANPAGLLAQ